MLVGVPAGDDAGIYDIGDGKALVQTVDVFTPSVDDPYTFGQTSPQIPSATSMPWAACR